MTDREERQHVIEILQKERKTALHDNKWAFDYAISSIEIDLKYDLLYEGVDCNNCKNNLHRGDGSTYCATGDGMCHYECEEPTTKNDLVVDCISREQALNEFCIYNPYDSIGVDKVRSYLKALPPVTPQEPKSEWEHDHEILRAYADGANNVLDKLRAEIDKARFIDKDTRIAKNALASGLEVAMQIIDKYKAETENP